MSGTRFARSGRTRYLLCFIALILMLGMVAIFHSTTRQLDEAKQEQMHCEQQQNSLNDQLKFIVEQKFSLQKSYENERSEQMETKRYLEQKIKELNELHTKEQMEANEKYGKLEQSFNLLESEHKNLVEENSKYKQKTSENANELEKRIQELRANLQKDKNNEIGVWRDKYNVIAKEKERLEVLLNAADSKTLLQTRVNELERILTDYQTHCDYKPNNIENLQLNKPLNPPDTLRKSSPAASVAEKSFKEQVLILAKPLKKLSDETETQIKQEQFDDEHEHEQVGAAPPPAAKSSALNVAGDKIVSPLSAPRKLTSTESTKLEKHLLYEADAHLRKATNASTISTSIGSKSSISLSPPLQIGNQTARKLPDNVAPIPANFEELLNKDVADLKAMEKKLVNAGGVDGSIGGGGDLADIDAAVEDKNDNHNDNNADNNRYANVVNEMKIGKNAIANNGAGDGVIANVNKPVPAPNGSKDINNKEHDINDDDDHFELANENVDDDKVHKDGLAENEDDDILAGVGGAGVDIAVKNHNQLLDAGDLNNEIAGDQGKDYADGGLQLEEGHEEDEDEDDYVNLAARQNGAQAIRN